MGTRRALRLLHIIEYEYGHFASHDTQTCIDKNGNPIPWYTYPAIEYLSQLDFSNKEVFEYGVGNSSLFWANRAKQVTSVEHNREWFLKVAGSRFQNQAVVLLENQREYVDSVLEGQGYDVIVIDGICRYDCARVAAGRVREGGLIILDNSDWYPNTAKLLREAGFIQVDFSGLGPINYYTWTTSLFIAREISIQAESEIQPQPSIASLILTAEDDKGLLTDRTQPNKPSSFQATTDLLGARGNTARYTCE
jgi:hypothetical protein